MKRHEPGPPLLFTMIMKAMVMPRTTSRESRRLTGDKVAVAGFVIVGAVTVLAIGGDVSRKEGCTYPTRSWRLSPRAPGGFARLRGATEAVQLNCAPSLSRTEERREGKRRQIASLKATGGACHVCWIDRVGKEVQSGVRPGNDS